MKAMVESGLLDMQRLATLGVTELVDALNMLTKDYAAWIAEQRARIGKDVIEYDTQAGQALDRCQEIQTRLQQGIDTQHLPATHFDRALRNCNTPEDWIALQQSATQARSG